jgi:hypothetical protein
LAVQRFVFAGFGAALLLASGVAMAADYRPGDFLTMDLSRAVLSPTPLGPPTEFAPVPVEDSSEPSGVLPHADTRKVAVEDVKGAPPRVKIARTTRRQSAVALASAEKRRGAARVKLAHRHHGDPFNAQAMDTRIQTWPCKSGGGICDWKR